jgi:hypothetical protein
MPKAPKERVVAKAASAKAAPVAAKPKAVSYDALFEKNSKNYGIGSLLDFVAPRTCSRHPVFLFLSSLLHTAHSRRQ